MQASARFSVLALILSVVLNAGTIRAGDLYSSDPSPTNAAVLPKAGEIKELTAYPLKVALKGGDDAAQLVITAGLNSGRSQDLSGDAQYSSADEKIAKVSKSGRVIPIGNGVTTITAKFLDKSVSVPVSAANIGDNLPIVPVPSGVQRA